MSARFGSLRAVLGICGALAWIVAIIGTLLILGGLFLYFSGYGLGIAITRILQGLGLLVTALIVSAMVQTSQVQLAIEANTREIATILRQANRQPEDISR